MTGKGKISEIRDSLEKNLNHRARRVHGENLVKEQYSVFSANSVVNAFFQ